MVLFFNTFLTSTPGNSSTTLDRGLLPSYSKLDITKYSLASLAAAYPWTRAIVNIELDPLCYSIDQKKDLEDFINQEFKNTDVVFSNKRIKSQEDWKAAYSLINSDMVMLLCNHDHIFIDSNREYLSELVQTARQSTEDYPTIVMSHWPENIRWAKSGYIDLAENFPRNFNNGYKLLDNHIQYKGVCLDSLNIITKKLYYNWFFEGDWKGVEIPRMDGLVGYNTLFNLRQHIGIPLPQQTFMIPYKEQLRHFDGYMHQRISNSVCPSLSIPPGFFQSNIKVRYGYDDYKEGWVNLNPKNNNYYAHSLDGTDDKITLEDIPLFWKNRVGEVDINPYINEEEMIQYRLYSILQMIYSDERYNPYIDQQVEDMVMNQYLQTYVNYQYAK
jgi:hypothetical protein